MGDRDLILLPAGEGRTGDVRLARSGRSGVLLAVVGASGAGAAEPGAGCTIVADPRSDAILLREGDCAERFSAASTFKVALALIGFDLGLLRDSHHPAVDFVPGTKALKRDQKRVDPTIWQRDSIVWYSRFLTAELGMPRLSASVSRLNYGNADVSGDPGLSNGLTQAWLGSSLRISPDEQARFLTRMLDHRLPVSDDAGLKTEQIVPKSEAAGGWVVHGETGSVIPRTGVPGPGKGVSQGWLVGWADRGDRRVVFVRFQEVPPDPEQPAGAAVQEGLLAALPSLSPLTRPGPAASGRNPTGAGRRAGASPASAGRRGPWPRACAAALLLSAIPCAAGSVRQDAVFNASQRIMRAYNDGDAQRLRDALSPEVADLNSLDQVRKTLEACKRSIGEHIERLSLPVSGTKHYGYIAAYLAGGQADMFVEIDDAGRIRFWTLSTDLLSGEHTCASAFDRTRLKRR